MTLACFEHMAVLKKAVERFADARVMVIGDPMTDVYHFGEVPRLSQEAPVPIFVEDRNDRRSGGALNVLGNLRALGCSVQALMPLEPWTEKHRYLVGHQQIFRIDRDQRHPAIHLDGPMLEIIDWANVLVISDYAKGSIARETCQAIIEAATAARVITVVDPKGKDWSAYEGATVICPNMAEWEGWDGKIDKPFDAILKRGAAGLSVIKGVSADKAMLDYHEIPARARTVFDVTGAGDTVVATAAAALAVEIPLVIAAELANRAAGLVVGGVGTCVCTQAHLLEELDHV